MGKDLVLVASFDWLPNQDAALRLIRGIWPRVRRHFARGAKLVLVGRNPSARVRWQASASVVVTGTVPSVWPYLANARLSAIPLRAGSGTRLKILEAAAAGVPVVCSRLAAEGLPVADGRHLLFAESDEDFVSAILAVETDGALRERLIAGGQELAASMQWHIVTQRLLSAFNPLPRGDSRDAVRPVVSERGAPGRVGRDRTGELLRRDDRASL